MNTRAEALAAANAADREDRSKRLRESSIEERLLETIALSSVLIADELRRKGGSVERPLPVGLRAGLV